MNSLTHNLPKVFLPLCGGDTILQMENRHPLGGFPFFTECV